MASDYAQDPEQRFANRRGIEIFKAIPERARSLGERLSRAFAHKEGNVPQVEIPQPQRSMFVGFKPPPMTVTVDRAETALARTIENGVVRYAKALDAIERQKARGLDALPHQISARDKAQAELKAIKTHMGKDVSSAFERNPALIGEAASGNTTRIIRAIQLEAEIRINPELRADRFVQDWNRVKSLHDKANSALRFDMAGRYANTLENFAKQLQRDPQMDSLLAIRRQQLGLYASRSSGGISHDLLRTIGRGRGLGISI